MFRRHKFNKKTKHNQRKKKSFRPETIVLIKQIFYGLLSVLFVSLTIWGIWHVTRLPALTIVNIEVDGGYTISHTEVKTVAEQAIAGEYLKLIPRTFSLLYPKQDITNAIKQLDKLKTVRLERITLDTLSIVIDEYIPYALWCNNHEADVCYLIDESGVAFTEAPPLSGSAFLRYRTLGRTPELFSVLTEKTQLQSVQVLVEQLEQKFDFLVLRVELDVVGDVFLILSGGSEIKVSRRLSPEETIRNLEAVLSAPEFTNLEPGDFPYIDLRFGNKVFVSDEWPVEEILEEEIEMVEIDIAEAVEGPLSNSEITSLEQEAFTEPIQESGTVREIENQNEEFETDEFEGPTNDNEAGV